MESDHCAHIMKVYLAFPASRHHNEKRIERWSVERRRIIAPWLSFFLGINLRTTFSSRRSFFLGINSGTTFSSKSGVTHRGLHGIQSPSTSGETESFKHCIIYPLKPAAGEVKYVESFIVVASTQGIFVGLSSSVYDFDEESSTSL